VLFGAHFNPESGVQSTPADQRIREGYSHDGGRNTMPIESHSPVPETRAVPEDAIAIVGLSCRLPKAPNPDAFWELLRNGEHAITDTPADRWDAASLFDPDPSVPGRTNSRWGGYLDTVDGFDARFFGVSPREARAMDPQQRLILELAWEALENAAIVPGGIRGSRTGVFVGAIADDYATLLGQHGVEAISSHSLTGLHRSIIANRVSYTLGLHGPSLTVDSGQSSSLVAVHMACESLRRGESTTALAGGVNLNLVPESTIRVAKFGGLSPQGRCFVFDARADGYVRGEGGGLVVLKPLARAVADGDRVHAVILGGAVNNDGAKTNLTVPDPVLQEEVLRLAADRAGVAPREVQYVELHGTGTRVGDPVEARALGAVFGAARAEGDAPLLVGSAKTNVGHLEGAAGIVGLLKAVLSLARREVPPNLNFETPNPDIPLDDLRLRVPRELTAWPRPDGPLLAGVSSFGMGGTNCHLVLSEAPGRPGAAGPDASGTGGSAVVPWPVSARDGLALRQQARQLRDFAAAAPELGVAEIAHALATTRTAFEHRAVVVGTERDELLAGLSALADGDESSPHVVRDVAVTERGGTVFVFPGQGGQWDTMARDLMDTSEVFRARIEACGAALGAYTDWDLVEVLRGAPGAPTLERVDVVQPALFAVMVSLAELWRHHGIEPDAVVGHSQGEIAAAYVAGALTLDDAARVVALRSKAITALAGGGGMISVALPADLAAIRLEGREDRLALATVNGPANVVVAGDPEALEELRGELEMDEVQVRTIPVDYASHSPHVEAVRDALLEVLAPIEPRTSAIPFYSTVTAGRLDTAALNAGYWYRNLRSTVRFEPTIRALAADGHTGYIEVSPHPVLTHPIHDTLDALDSATRLVTGTLRRDEHAPTCLVSALARAHSHGLPVDWHTMPGPRLPLPTYPFQRQRYWLDTPAGALRQVIHTPAAHPAPDEEEPAAEALPPVRARLARLPESDWESALLDAVRGQAAAVLGHASPQEIGPQETFKDLGFDSVMSGELRRRLSTATGLRLKATLVFDAPTPGQVAKHLRAELAPDEPDTGVPHILGDLERLEASLTTASVDNDTHLDITTRLRSLLSRWTRDISVPQPAAVRDQLESASTEEVFAFIDQELRKSRP
jgi:acyl transferase domain-containing protein